MNILHIGKYFPPFFGGMENYLRDLMVAQSRRGDSVSALVHAGEPSLRGSDETYTFRGQSFRISRAALWLRMLFTPMSPGFPWRLHRMIKEEQPDILHLHMPNVSVFWCLFMPSARRVSWVVHWHADVLASTHSTGLRWFYRLYRPFERAVLKRAARVIVTSPPYLDTSEPLADFRDKAVVVPLGLDREFGDGVVSQRSALPGETEGRPLRLLAIGRLTYYKGFKYLLRAMEGLEDWELTIVGEGDQAESLARLCQSLELDHRVHLVGRATEDQLKDLFAGADCLCLPSIERTEAFGMVLLEAMSCGLPTIVTTVPGSGMHWVVEDGATGHHVPPQNPDALRCTLRSLAGSRATLKAFGAAGRARFEASFEIGASAAGLDGVYGSILKARAP